MLDIISKGLAKVFGTKTDRDLKELYPYVALINAEFDKLKDISDDELRGKTQELRDEMKSTKKMMKMLKKMYLSKTEIPEKKFKRLMQKDIYLTPSKCLKYKIAHVVD